MSAKQLIRASLEAIDFQNGNFFNDLIAPVANIREQINEGVDPYSIKTKDFADVVKKYTNLTVELDVMKGAPDAFMCTAMMDFNNVLEIHDKRTNGRDYWQTDSIVRIMRSFKDGISAGIDLKTSKVSGFFADYPTVLGITIDIFLYLNDREIAATLLHEIGHIFSYFEFTGFTYTCNQVLRNVLSTFFATDDNKQRLLTLTHYEDATNAKIENKESLANNPKTNQAIITTIVLKSFLASVRSASGTYVYDIRSFEQLSDNFASRHGASRDLATGLMKLHKADGDDAVSPWILTMTSTVIKDLIFLPFSIILLPFMADLFYPDRLWSRYDTYQDRIANLRRTLVDSIKSLNLKEDSKKKALEDIQVIDNLIAESNSIHSIFVDVCLFFNSTRKKELDQVKFQKELEELASNRLYISATKLNLNKGE